MCKSSNKKSNRATELTKYALESYEFWLFIAHNVLSLTLILFSLILKTVTTNSRNTDYQKWLPWNNGLLRPDPF